MITYHAENLKTYSANICLGEDVKKTPFVFIFRRRLQDVFEMSWSNWIYLPGSCVFKRRLQDVLKISSRRLARTSSRHLFKIFWRHFQDIFKMSCQDVFKTSSECLHYVFNTYSRRLWDTFKMYHEVKLFFLARLQNVFKTYLARVWDALRRRLSIEIFA